jgi:hypothetical protein
MGCWEYNNEFTVQDLSGNQMFKAKEKSDCMMRLCCGNIRCRECETGTRTQHLWFFLNLASQTNIFSYLHTYIVTGIKKAPKDDPIQD